MLSKLVGYVKNSFDWKKAKPDVVTLERRFFKLDSEYYSCFYQDSFYAAQQLAFDAYISANGRFPKAHMIVPGSWVVPGPIKGGITQSATLHEVFTEMVKRDPSLHTKGAVRIKWPD